jgi:hypothetical protein
MLHPSVTAEMVADEASVTRERHGHRVAEIQVTGSEVVLRFGEYRMKLDGAHYDAEPFRLSFIDAGGNAVAASAWPAGLSAGVHPVLQVPWGCVQGTYEYHMYPGHASDVWDKHRARLRMADLVDPLLRRCGR